MNFIRPWFRIVVIILFLVLGINLCGCKDDVVQRLKKGDQAPEFETIDMNGKQISMASFQGNPIILRFWSVNCKYCRADTPIFNQYFNRYKDQGLIVIYVNILSDINEVREFIHDLNIQFPVIIDKDGAIAASYQVKLVPQTIIINPEHKIVAAQLGGVGEKELRTFLSPYLQLTP